MNRILALFLRRLWQTLPSMLFATLVVFTLLHMVPGDTSAALAGDNASAERIEEVRRLYGLDRPLFAQYGYWIWNALHGDLGQSLFANQPVMALILQRLPNTVLLAVLGLSFTAALGIPLGIAAAVRPGSRVDKAVSIVASLGVAVPSFWLALVLILNLSLRVRLFPSTGAVSFGTDPLAALHHAVLPAVALAAGAVSEVARQVRSALIEVLGSQHVRTLHAKGLSPARVLWKHGLRNIGATLSTVMGLQVNRLLSGAVVIEAVFAIPGVGSLIAESALQRDFPVVQGVVLFLVGIVILANFTADALAALLDPRVMEST